MSAPPPPATPTKAPLDAYTQQAITRLKAMRTGGYGQPTPEDITDFVATLKSLPPGTLERQCVKWRVAPLSFNHRGRDWDMFYTEAHGWVAEKDRNS